MARARRCGARTRAGHPCRQAAVTGRARCRMHGGARGSGGPQGDRNEKFNGVPMGANPSTTIDTC
ncbi:MAG: HGGxSTG domain-containing protein [Xanthobacteraceae bacterium]